MTGYHGLRPTMGDLFPEARKLEQLNQLDRELEAEAKHQRYLPSNSYSISDIISGPIGSWTYDATIPLNVPTNGFVAIYAEAEIETFTLNGMRGYVGIRDTVEFSTAHRIISMASNEPFTRCVSSSGYEYAARWPFGSFVVLPASQGIHNYSLAYMTQSGATAAARFRNRKLTVMVW